MVISCTKADRTLTLTYEPQVSVAKIDKNNTPISVTVYDVRAHMAKVGSIPLDQMGLIKIPITIDQSIDSFLQEAMEVELKQRGFFISQEGKALSIDVVDLFGELDKTFVNIGTTKIYKHDAVGGIVLALRIFDSKGQILFANKVQKKVRINNVKDIFKSTKITSKALNKAIREVLRDLFEDENFTSALLK